MCVVGTQEYVRLKAYHSLSLKRPPLQIAATEGGGDLFELAAEGRHSLNVPLAFFALALACFFSICPLIFFQLWPQHVFLLVAPAKSILLAINSFFPSLGLQT